MLIHKNNNFIGLLIGQLTLIFISPLMQYFDVSLSKYFLHLAIIGMMLFTVIGNQENRQWFRSILILAALEIVILLLSAIFSEILLVYLAISISLFFLVTSTVVAFNSVFFSRLISFNQLVGASCIYLLLGIIWAILYSNLYFFSPGSFSGLEYERGLHFSEFMYYSYVTLTTLGFGDITPLSPMAKTLSFTQAITGQLYLTIMVAGLVGKAINHHSHS